MNNNRQVQVDQLKAVSDKVSVVSKVSTTNLNKEDKAVVKDNHSVMFSKNSKSSSLGANKEEVKKEVNRQLRVKTLL